MRLVTWIPIVVLLLLIGVAWIAFQSERPFTFAFDEPPTANTVADPEAPAGSETISGTVLGAEGRPAALEPGRGFAAED